MGATLLVRAGRRFRPSDAGHANVVHSKRILADLRQLNQLAQSDLNLGELRLGAISTALTGLPPQAQRHLFRYDVGGDVFILPGTSPELYRHLLENRVDGAILVRPPYAIPKTLNWRLLRSEPMVLLCPKALTDPLTLLRDHPLYPL